MPGKSFGVPARPRQSNPEEPDYEPEEEYNAWAHGGENFHNSKQLTVETPEERNIRLGLSDSNLTSEGGGYGKKRKGEESRGEMNLTGSQGRSILTSERGQYG